MKFLLKSVAFCIASFPIFLGSCSQQEEQVFSPEPDFTNDETIDFKISVDIPSEFQSRNSSENGTWGYIGESGLFEFPSVNINRLRYAAYSHGELLFSNSITRFDNNPFDITLSLQKYTDPTSIFLFFWADSQTDTRYEEYKIDFKNKTVDAGAYSVQENDDVPFDYGYKPAFTGYYQLATSLEDSKKSKTFILKRPFAEIHVLTDEIYKTDLVDFFDYGTKAYYGFGDDNANYSNCTLQMYKPEIWHFDESQDSHYSKGDFEFIRFPRKGGQSYQDYFTPFENLLDGSLTTNFYGRDLEYLCCFTVFVPEDGMAFKFQNIDDIRYLNKINVGVIDSESNFTQKTSKFFTLDFPENGLKPNHKYIYYNKPFEEGGAGFLGGTLTYELLAEEDK